MQILLMMNIQGRSSRFVIGQFADYFYISDEKEEKMSTLSSDTRVCVCENGRI